MSMGGIYLRISQYCGHLSKELGFDDVMYAIDAAGRLLIAADHGFVEFLKSFWDVVPHSPFSSLLALGAFAIGGVNEVALYTANTVILIGLAWLLVSELKDTSRGMFAICLALVLLSPISYRVIEEFRPDIALGIATAVMGWWFTGGILSGESRLFKKAGLALGICFLIKPTFFAHTIAISLFLAGLFILVQIVRNHGVGLSATSQLSHLAWYFGLAALVAAPYFAMNGMAMVRYFWDNALGVHHVERCLPETYSLREVLNVIFGPWNYLGNGLRFLATGIAGSVAILFWRGAKAEALRLLAFMPMALVSLGIVVVGRHNNPFFLATFQWTVLLAATFGIASLHASVSVAWKRVLCGVCAGVLVLGVCARDTHWRNERRSSRQSDAYEGGGSGWNQKLFEQIQKHEESLTEGGLFARAGGYWNREIWATIPRPARFQPVSGHEPPPRVFFAFTGGVNRFTFEWTGIKHGFVPHTIDVFSAEIAESIKLAEASEYTVVATDSANIDNLMLNYRVQAAFRKWIVSNPRFNKLPDISANPYYSVYVNKTLMQPVVFWTGKWRDGWIGVKSSFILLACERDALRIEIAPINVPEFMPNTVTIKIAEVIYKSTVFSKGTVIQIEIPIEKLANQAVVELEFERAYTPPGEMRGLCAQVRVLN